MFDLWGFLLQTLTASGVAALLLILKALLRDQLPPKWHFAVWGVLGIALLLPAGLGGRYVLFHWQFIVEMLKAWSRDYSATRVLFPIPVITAFPRTTTEWIFAGYVLGVIVSMVKYAVSYIRLRHTLRGAAAPCAETVTHIEILAAVHGVKPCRIIEVPNLPSAFVCGVFRPILALPADRDVDDKVLLHELLHLKYKDTFWSVVICLFRCLHWCNPLLRYCANLAANDLEARCDQRVLERLQGEARRDYGQILLSMANDRFAKTPASTCMNNGGKNIRKRIEAIARFKLYPVGMRLVSVCVILVLICSLFVGAQATKLYDTSPSMRVSVASARSTPCTTPAGALDTYAKAMFAQNGLYWVMCAPQSMQKEIANWLVVKGYPAAIYPGRDVDLPTSLDVESGYFIYNLTPCGKHAYEGILAVRLMEQTDNRGKPYERRLAAVQNLRVEKENTRWVVVPLDDVKTIELSNNSLAWGCSELPGWTYTGTAADFRADVTIQTVHTVDNTKSDPNDLFAMMGFTPFDTTPIPNARFDEIRFCHSSCCTYVGSQAQKANIQRIGLSTAPVYEGEERPDDMLSAASSDFGSSRNDGASAGGCEVSDDLGQQTIELGGGGSNNFDPNKTIEFPIYYAADLYINGELAAKTELYMQEEAAK